MKNPQPVNPDDILSHLAKADTAMPDGAPAPSQEAHKAHGKLFNVIAGLGAAALVGGAIALANTQGGPDFSNSPVARGVDAQVETHRTRTRCGLKIGGTICSQTITDYYLGVEQCEEDARHVWEGQRTVSYDPRVGVIGTGCTYGEVSVTSDEYSAFADGSNIIWPGSPDQNVG